MFFAGFRMIFWLQLQQIWYDDISVMSKNSSRSVLLVDGSSFGGSRLGNGSHRSIKHYICVVPSESLPFFDFRRKLVNL